MTSLPIQNLLKYASYDPLSSDTQAELSSWREDPEESIESRNKQINIHRRPGFYKKGLLGSIALNALLMMAVTWMYMRMIT